MRARRAALATLLAGLAVPACSLIVNDLSPGRCIRFDDCAPLNERDGLDALSCELWTCDVSSTQCVRRPRDRDGDGAFGPYPARSTCDYPVTDCDDDDPKRSPNQTEICDGVDNDCDLAIDESTDAMHAMAREGATAGPFPLGDGSEPPSLGFPSLQEPAARMLVVATRRAGNVDGQRVALGASDVGPLTWQTYCGTSTARAGCASTADCTSAPVLTCGFGAAALDFAGTSAWVVAANEANCSGGDVRVASLGDATASIDATGAAVAGVPACSDGPARTPAMAALAGASGLQLALVAHLAESPASTRACGSGAVMVRARAVRLTDATKGRVDFVIGVPMLDVAQTLATSAPAIVAVDSAGWVLAFGAAAGGADLFWIPADGATATKIATVGTEPTGEVRISARAGTSPVTLGVVRQAGCGSGPIVYQTVHFDPSDPIGSFATSAPVTLAASGRGPAVVRVDGGLVMEGFSRDRTPPIEGPVATAAQTGGWIALWSDVEMQGDAWASRILSLDDQPLGDRDRVSDTPGRVSWVARATSGLADAYVFGDDALVHAVALYCTSR